MSGLHRHVPEAIGPEPIEPIECRRCGKAIVYVEPGPNRRGYWRLDRSRVSRATSGATHAS